MNPHEPGGAEAATRRTPVRSGDLGAVAPPLVCADRTALAAAVFAAFDRAGLRWCLVGDDRAVAAGFDNDLDLVVARRDLARVPALLR
nr:hypothetical protein [Planctomycetota bacterium]